MSSSEEVWRQAILPADATIAQAVRNLNEVAIKIVLVANEGGVLVGTISDGDIRRGLLKDLDINSPISSIINRNAFVVPPEMGRDLVMQLMVANKIQQIPVVDDYGGGLRNKVASAYGKLPKTFIARCGQTYARTYHSAR